MKILAVIGTRPEAIKMLPLVIELRSRRKMDVKIAFSGQHKTLANDVFDFFDITPDFVLDAMRDGQELCTLTCKLLDYFDMLFAREMPDIVLVHGDTATAFCASLAAFYRGIRTAHVEAGLRTFKLRSPFPEELYRIAIDAMSDIHFAPTSTSARNLEKEGRNTVFTVGNTVIDALKYTVKDDYLLPLSECEGQRKTVLLTMHRRENLGKKMLSSLQGIRRILLSRDDLFCILPMHPNPLVGESVQKAFKDIKNIKINWDIIFIFF